MDSLIQLAVYGAAAGATWFAAPVVLSAIGFKSVGIAAGSYAASMMSTLGGGFTSAGGVVATCQSIGATGSVLGSTAGILITGTTAAVVGGAITKVIR
ncbi:hypothetical protein PV327_002123 [Microctonus hyperodae]|uniref:Uncharacterized protein n=1 Tax=Microctonus hyperodae TaxID=165561 RepID=A0AA39FEW2_MICHY|nr:hypothetical protein PV327_002123 [Microctonus hyperodae]